MILTVLHSLTNALIVQRTLISNVEAAGVSDGGLAKWGKVERSGARKSSGRFCHVLGYSMRATATSRLS